jgi:hypothetical protein
MITPTLEVISAFATGSANGKLELVRAVSVQQIDNNDALVAAVRLPTNVPVKQRTKLRFTGNDGYVREYRVRRYRTNTQNRVMEIEAGPVWMDLATAGDTATTNANATTFTIEATLSASDWLTSLVLTNLASDGLTWLDTVLGTIEATGTRYFKFVNATRLEILQAVAAAFQVEWSIAQPSPGALYRINLFTQRGASAGVSYFALARNVMLKDTESADDQLVTHVKPLGDTPSGGVDSATLADNLWRVSAITSGWVSLVDPAGGSAPIALDDLANTMTLFGPMTGSTAPLTYQVLDSRASDGAVLLSSTSGLAVGALVSLRRNASGDGVYELMHPVAAAEYDRVVATPEMNGMRGEANYVEDGRFVNGLANWAAINGTTPPNFVEVKRSELGVTLSGQANGARAAATGTGTPFAIKGLPANSFVRQQALIKVGGATLPVTADAIPDTSGALTLALGGAGLPGSYPDNTPFTLIRREVRTWTLDGEHSVLATNLRFTDSNTDGIFAVNTGTLTSTSGGFVAGMQTVQYVDAPLFAGRIRVSPPFGFFQALDLGASSVTPDFAFVRFVNAFFGATVGSIRIIGTQATPVVVGTTRLSFRGTNGVVVCARVSANLGGGDFEITAENGSVFYGFNGQGYDAVNDWFVMTVSNGVMASGSTWTATLTRETRTVFCNGPVSAGAMSLPCKAQANLATRNWTASDTISMTRDIACTVDVTAAGSIVDEFEFDIDLGMDVFIGKSHSVTFNAATSTFDEVDAADRPNPLFLGEWRFVSIVGSTINLFKAPDDPGPSNPLPTGVLNLAWAVTDTYALTGTASWGTNGRVTLNLASAIPAGRSYARGLPVGSNWVSGFMRLHAARSGGNSTVELFGHDAFFSNTDPSSASRGALYRITASGSTMPIPGNTLTAAATAQADGSGNASVTLTAANANAIANNETVTIATPQMLRPSDPRTGSIVRLLYAVGNSSIPLTATPGIRSNYWWVPVPVGGSKVVTVYGVIAMNTGAYTLGQLPAVAVVGTAREILGYTRFADATVNVGTLVHGTLIASATITTSRAVAIAAYGGFVDTPGSWHALIEGWGIISPATDVPFVNGSHANALWLSAIKYLQVYGRAVSKLSVTVAQLQAATGMTLLPTAPVIGQTIRDEDTGDTVRLAAVSIDHFDFTRTEYTLDSLRPTAARLLGVR